MPDPAVLEADEVAASAEPIEESQAQATGGLTEGGAALDLMRDALREMAPKETPEDQPEAEGEATPEEGAPESDATSDEKKPSSRRAKTVERVQTEAEQKVAEANERAATAEADRQRIIQEYEQDKTARASEQARLNGLIQEYGQWTGDQNAYAEAQRISRMHVDDPAFDFDKHKQAVSNLNYWDQNRRWVGVIQQTEAQKAQASAWAAIEHDIVQEPAKDLPEDKRAKFIKHPDGPTAAIRYYGATLVAAAKEEAAGEIAELKAKLDKARASGGGRSSPEVGGARAAGPAAPNFSKMSPEELMTYELREQQRESARRR